MRLSKKHIIIIGCSILFFLIFRYFNLGSYFSFDQLQVYKDILKNHVHQNYFLAVGIYMLTYIVAVCLSLPAAALSMLGGFLFGLLPAITMIVVSATIGASAIFLVVRHFFGTRLQEKYKVKLKKFNAEIAENGMYYLITLRLSVFIPFFLVNVLAGLTRIPLSIFATTTLVGIIPASVVFTYAGEQLQTVKGIRDVFTPNMVLAFMLLAALSLIPVFINHWKKRKKQ